MKGTIFIVGPHRSGSTLWHNLVAMAPGVLRLAEPRFLAPPRQRDFKFFLKSQAGDLSRDEDVDKLVELCFSRKGFPGLEGAFWRFEGIEFANDPAVQKAIAQNIKASDRSIGAICRAIVEEFTRASGCERACVKFPVDVEHIPELISWFPGCKVIHITRDPRAMAMSKSNDPSGTALRVLDHPNMAWAIRKFALWHVVSEYRRTSQLYSEFCKFTDSYRLFRYEDLLVNPAKTLRDLCDFAGVQFVPEMLEPQRGRHDHQPSSLTGKRTKSFDASAAIRWTEVISPLDNWLISSMTRGSMKRLGYDPKTHPIFQH